MQEEVLAGTFFLNENPIIIFFLILEHQMIL
jgi:hypothetical protein